jgi:hypothetical protein
LDGGCYGRHFAVMHADVRLLAQLSGRAAPGLLQDDPELELGLEPIHFIVSAVELPQLFGDGRNQTMGQVDLAIRVRNWTDDDSHE